MGPLPTRKPFLQDAGASASVPGTPAALPGALYVHVPFCRAPCRYCDFCRVVYEPALARAVVDATLEDLARRHEQLRRPLDTLFVGGGTPTVLEPSLLEHLLAALGPHYTAAAEVTVEANPNSLSPEVIVILRQAGVNRLSLGVQSFQGDELAFLGRLHSEEEARSATRLARAGGFDNLSLDLIYGIPNQTSASWRRSLEAAIESGVDHLSCYCLAVEPGTPLADDLRAGRVQPMDESLQRECYYLAIELLGGCGLEQYEISNFARAGRQSRHNLTYWHNEPYIGIGPSAASYVDLVRSVNTADLAEYVARVSGGKDPTASSERLTGRELMGETLMLGLRLREGIDRKSFANRFGHDAVESFRRSIMRHADLGLLRVTPDCLALEPAALFVADSVLADILADDGA